ncbi:hypothetical protein L2E82_24849 [Cichorium intybus]|uniref:Uncharacterized protein n=1 Tax=Cichorium intybus TaxID=13427 RepID=A0ACB9E205_CICIN|nr:hypothetical protein L2E82_24849 [Cichorium intybus]
MGPAVGALLEEMVEDNKDDMMDNKDDVDLVKGMENMECGDVKIAKTEVVGKEVASLEAMLLVGVFEDPEVVVEGGSKGVVPTLDASEGLWWNFYAVVFKPDW